jgi:pimeloyl-ACP methyl ester carboxylesterase
MSRAGYDVWFGNSRGNKYSHSHRNPSISNYDFFNYSFAEMGTGDLPAVINYVRAVTGQDKLAFIGHSQGTSQMYYALAHNEDFFADKVSVFIALGPVMKLTHCKSDLLQLVSSNDVLLLDTCKALGIYEFFPANWLTTGAMRLLCGTLPSLCALGDYLVADEDLSLDDKDRLTVYLGHFPSGTSLRCLEHYSQIM